MRLAAAAYSARSWSTALVMTRQGSQTKARREDPGEPASSGARRESLPDDTPRLRRWRWLRPVGGQWVRGLVATVSADDRPPTKKQAAHHDGHHQGHAGEHDRGVAVYQHGGSPPRHPCPLGAARNAGDVAHDVGNAASPSSVEGTGLTASPQATKGRSPRAMTRCSRGSLKPASGSQPRLGRRSACRRSRPMPGASPLRGRAGRVGSSVLPWPGWRGPRRMIHPQRRCRSVRRLAAASYSLTSW